MTKHCCDRSVFARTLETMLQNLAKINSLVTQHAEEMGLESLGVLDKRPEGVPVLRFPFDSQLKIKWNEVDAQLATIGRITGLYTVPHEMLMGIRGKDADILVRLVDIQQRRLHGVLQYFKDTPIIPPWFKVGAKVRLHDCGPVYEVVSIDPIEKSWVASEYGTLGKFPLDEVAEHWSPCPESVVKMG
jgi:hypothetical protein